MTLEAQSCLISHDEQQNFQPPATQEDARRMLSDAASKREHFRLQSELAKSQYQAAQVAAELHCVKANDAQQALKFADLLVSRIRLVINKSNYNEVLPDDSPVACVDSIPIHSDGGKYFELPSLILILIYDDLKSSTGWTTRMGRSPFIWIDIPHQQLHTLFLFPSVSCTLNCDPVSARFLQLEVLLILPHEQAVGLRIQCHLCLAFNTLSHLPSLLSTVSRQRLTCFPLPHRTCHLSLTSCNILNPFFFLLVSNMIGGIVSCRCCGTKKVMAPYSIWFLFGSRSVFIVVM